MCAVAVVARRRSEGTYPINKTTRVTIEFNRKKNGFQSTNGVDEGERARRDPRSKSPSTYAPLLFIVPNFHSQRTAIRRFAKREKERKKYREKGRERRGEIEKPFSRVTAVSLESFLVEVNDTDFVHFLFSPEVIGKAQLCSRDREDRREIARYEKKRSTSQVPGN